MSRRARAAAFLVLAAVAAVTGAATIAGYGSRVAQVYGPLRRVVVISKSLPRGAPIAPGRAAEALEVRRIPARFVPPGTVSEPGAAIGLVARGPLPAGSYLLAGQLGPPRPRRRTRLGSGRHPVEIAVSGAGALLALGAPHGERVDVVVTAEPRGPGPGRTYVAAAAVPLLALSTGEDGAAGLSAATLALRRAEALRLIAAESFARKVTLLPVG